VVSTLPKYYNRLLSHLSFTQVHQERCQPSSSGTTSTSICFGGFQGVSSSFRRTVVSDCDSNIHFCGVLNLYFRSHHVGLDWFEFHWWVLIGQEKLYILSLVVPRSRVRNTLLGVWSSLVRTGTRTIKWEWDTSWSDKNKRRGWFEHWTLVIEPPQRMLTDQIKLNKTKHDYIFVF
jgi:hypothetical protein